MMTDRIRSFLNERRPEGPCLVVDLDVVRENYRSFTRALPDSRIFYAVKANPAPEILNLLASLGSSFDAASVPEIEMALATGATPDRISYGNTIKKERDIARAFELGVRLFAVDCVEEVEKIARVAPGARVFCRILTDGAGAEWPLSRKFGCVADEAVDVLAHARAASASCPTASPSMSARSRPTSTRGTARLPTRPWCSAPAPTAACSSPWSISAAASPPATSRTCRRREEYGQAIFQGLRRHFGNRIPETIIEPGRGMVGDAGVLKAEVVLVSKKSRADTVRWVYLDVGKFGGLAETMDEAIRYPIVTPRHGDTGPCVVAGPTCDSADVLYEKLPYELPLTLTVGDEVLIEGTGAYTTTYSAVAFNGFAPLQSYVI